MTLKNMRLKKAGVPVHEADAVNFIDGANTTITVAYDSDNDEIDVTIAAEGAAGAPSTTDYLVGTADAGLSNEIVVGATPGGELGGTWGAPTVDATHSGSTHGAATTTHEAAADPHTGYVKENDASWVDLTDLGETALHTHAGGGGGAPTDADYLVGTANAGLSAEIVVGATPGGELGGTWGSPTVDATHSGSAHHAQAHSGVDHTDPAAPVTQAFADVAAAGTGTLPPANEDHKHGMPANPVTAHEGAADPHTGYRLESADHTHATTGLQAGTIDHGVITGLTDDDHTQYRLESADHTHQSAGAEAGKLDHGLALNGLTDDDHTQYVLKTSLDAVAFSVGALFEGAPPANGFRMAWRAPFACTVTNVRGHIDAGTNAVVNARKNQLSDFLATDLTVSSANAWADGGAVQNTAIAAGDDIELEIVSTSGAVTKVNIQVDLTRDMSP